MLRFLAGLLLLVFINPASLRSQTVTVSRLDVDSCHAYLQADIRWRVLTIRISPSGCSLSQNQLLQLFQLADSREDLLFQRHRFTSIFIGRAVDYPWLSNFLIRQALRDSSWSRKSGRPTRAPINRYVARLLEPHPFLGQLNSVLSRWHYRIAGVSVEKVLVGRYRQLPGYTGPEFKGGVPFDAQIYLLIRASEGR